MSTDDNADTETSANLGHRETTTGTVETGSPNWDTNADIVSCCNHGHLNVTVVSNLGKQHMLQSSKELN